MKRDVLLRPAKLLAVCLSLSLLCLSPTGCKQDEESGGSGGTSGNSGKYIVEETNSHGNFRYTKDLGSTPKSVVFMFTNDSTGDTTTTPTVSANMAGTMGYSQGVNGNSMGKIDSQQSLVDYAKEHGIGLRGTPEVTAFNANPPPLSSSGARQFNLFPSPDAPSFSSVGDTHSFMNTAPGDTIPSTLRHQIVNSDTGVTLDMWVANDAWDTGCTKTNCVTQPMLTQFGDKFSKSGANNDIYDWVTTIFGKPWGAHSYNEIIDPTADKKIDILFFDIDNDNSINGGVLGFFWAKDNLLLSHRDNSNERLMFYIDSVLVATPEGGSWEITDYWPSELVSTLAHEFQHMINFYQKTILRAGAPAKTYINEMASLMTEDLLADKLGTEGPRGVAHDNPTAGSSGNTHGRLPRYNYYNYVGVADWYSGMPDVLNSYSINYAFGAYLGRNFGGAKFFRAMVQNDKTDSQAITSALATLGYTGETFQTVLRKWGVAVLRSDDTSSPLYYRYNTGSYFTSTIDGITYNLGSINFYNYEAGGLSGPRFFEPGYKLPLEYKTSNIFYKVGENLTGNLSKNITTDTGIDFTVIIGSD